MKKVLSCFLVITMLFSMATLTLAEETNTSEPNTLPYVIEPQFESASEFNKYGIARVQMASVGNETGEVGVINLEGEKVFGFDGTKFVIRKNGLIMALGENDKAAFSAVKESSSQTMCTKPLKEFSRKPLTR